MPRTRPTSRRVSIRRISTWSSCTTASPPPSSSTTTTCACANPAAPATSSTPVLPAATAAPPSTSAAASSPRAIPSAPPAPPTSTRSPPTSGARPATARSPTPRSVSPTSSAWARPAASTSWRSRPSDSPTAAFWRWKVGPQPCFHRQNVQLEVEVAVEHPVHVGDVALLAFVEAQAAEAAGVHACLDLGHVGVVLVGDLAPVLGRPVGVETAFGHGALVAGRAPLEDPDVLQRRVGVEAVGAHAEEDGAARVDGADHVGEPVHVLGAGHAVGREVGDVEAARRQQLHAPLLVGAEQRPRRQACGAQLVDHGLLVLQKGAA